MSRFITVRIIDKIQRIENSINYLKTIKQVEVNPFLLKKAPLKKEEGCCREKPSLLLFLIFRFVGLIGNINSTETKLF